MSATVAVVELIGYVTLLLWGMHMVQSGVVRAFGSDLRRVIGRTLRNRFAAAGAGLVVTALLQSSTATAMRPPRSLPMAWWHWCRRSRSCWAPTLVRR